MAKEPKKSYSCGAVVWRRGPSGIEILLIKQFAHKDSWGIPKGHIDDGETFEACALREVKEEAGVDVELGQKLPECETFWKKEHKIVISYLAKQIGDAIPNTNDPDCEVAEVKWFPIGELPRIHLYQQPLLAYVSQLLGQDDVDER